MTTVLIDAGFQEMVYILCCQKPAMNKLNLFPNEIPYGLDIVFVRWFSGDNSRDYFKPQGKK